MQFFAHRLQIFVVFKLIVELLQQVCADLFWGTLQTKNKYNTFSVVYRTLNSINII